MIKSVGLLTRKDGLSHEDFVKHWFEIHAPLAHAVPGVRRYVQSHILGERTRPDIPTTDVEIDGIAELWYDDLEAMERANATPDAKRLHPALLVLFNGFLALVSIACLIGIWFGRVPA